MQITTSSQSHTVEFSGQYCECGQDAVSCQVCGRRVCGNSTKWVDSKGNVCAVCGNKPIRILGAFKVGENQYQARVVFMAWSRTFTALTVNEAEALAETFFANATNGAI